MRTHFSPRMRPLSALCAAVALIGAGLPLSSQTARIHSNTTPAELRIHVIVVPAIAIHRHHQDKDTGKNQDRDEGAIIYDLQPQTEEFAVTEEVRSMLVGSGNSAARQQQVRIITVVPK